MGQQLLPQSELLLRLPQNVVVVGPHRCHLTFVLLTDWLLACFLLVLFSTRMHLFDYDVAWLELASGGQDV